MPNPSDLLSRNDAAEALTQAGFKITASTLATMATRGGGPRYRHFGSRTMYCRSDLLEWAASRLSHPVVTASELSVNKALSAVSDLIALNPMLPRL